MNRDTRRDPEARCCAVHPRPSPQCCCCTLSRLICKPAPTSGSRWKRNPTSIDPCLKSNLMKAIKAEQTLTWNASSPRHRCVRDRSQAAHGVTTSMITRKQRVNNANEYLRESCARPEMGPVGKHSLGGLAVRQTWKFTCDIGIIYHLFADGKW